MRLQLPMNTPSSQPSTAPGAAERTGKDLRTGPLPAVLKGARALSRRCFVATRVVLAQSYRDAGRAAGAALDPHLDWEATWALRRALAQRGHGTAEGLDLFEREHLGWPLIERLYAGVSGLGLSTGFVAGAAADHLPPGPTTEELIAGVTEQATRIEELGGMPVLLPLVALARRRPNEDEVVAVYGAILERLGGPVLVDWPAASVVPVLAGYFPGRSFERVMALDPGKVRGARLTQHDARSVVRLRGQCLARGQALFVGDDPLFARWLLGGNPGTAAASCAAIERSVELGGQELALGDFCHGMLGLIEGLGTPVEEALARLESGDAAATLAAFEPLEALARWILRAPARLVPAALAFLAWVDGRQPNPMLPGRVERERDADDYRRLYSLAREAGALADPDAAERRLAGLERELGS